jgi:hypothetical protein
VCASASRRSSFFNKAELRQKCRPHDPAGHRDTNRLVHSNRQADEACRVPFDVEGLAGEQVYDI